MNRQSFIGESILKQAALRKSHVALKMLWERGAQFFTPGGSGEVAILVATAQFDVLRQVLKEFEAAGRLIPPAHLRGEQYSSVLHAAAHSEDSLGAISFVLDPKNAASLGVTHSRIAEWMASSPSPIDALLDLRRESQVLHLLQLLVELGYDCGAPFQSVRVAETVLCVFHCLSAS